MIMAARLSRSFISQLWHHHQGTVSTITKAAISRGLLHHKPHMVQLNFNRRLYIGHHLCKKKSHGTGDSKADVKESEIHLFGAEGKDLGMLSKSEAEKHAKELNLKLVAIEGTKLSKHVYKMMTPAEYADHMKALREEAREMKRKEPKHIKLTSKIDPHDLETKVNQVLKHLERGHYVEVTVNAAKRDTNTKRMNGLLQHFTHKCKNMAVVKNARHTDKLLVFLLQPIALDPGHTEVPNPITNAELKKRKDLNPPNEEEH